MPSLDRDHWSVLSPLLDRAFELEPGELARWLEAMRVEQPSLADELERLLADRDAMRRDRFLESESPGEPIRTVGPYRLIRVLGEGGMGTVHLAEQTGKIRRLVALKVIRPG
ncbi:MAG TPA: hypothetical protein VFO11_10590, partial [Candidatus Polarisedimenticolaceae bacterium]|nr:hypothetical protein [Candidatus Polarisedimenticolaceae bacterium]